MAEETIFYQDGNILISNTRFVDNSKMFPMAQITSCNHTYVQTQSSFMQTFPKVALIFFGIMFVAGGLVLALPGPMVSPIKSILSLGVWIVAIGAGIYAWKKLSYNYTTYYVEIYTTAGKAHSVSSGDNNRTHKIIEALNNAIIHRG